VYIDKRFIYIILAIVAVYSIIGLLSNPAQLLLLLYSIPGVLIAITFHEYAHAFAADKLGDDTPRLQGRLSLNPLAHLDPVGSLMLLFVRFGWGKPVQINPRNFNRTISMSAGEAIVSAAGPIMNFILAIVFCIIYWVIVKFAGAFVATQVGGIILTIIMSTVVINIGLGIFNLIPIPPLDGSKILKNFLPYKAKVWMESNSQLFYIIFLVLWFLGILSSIISPIIGWVSSFLINGIGSLFGF
jgi:Zn-dependent protease